MFKYSTVSVPKDLHEEIRRSVVENPRWGYGSVAEFSKEAIVLRLKELRKEIGDEEAKKNEIKHKLAGLKKSLLTLRKD